MTLSEDQFQCHATLCALDRDFHTGLLNTVTSGDAIQNIEDNLDKQLEQSFQDGFDAGISASNQDNGQRAALTEALTNLESENPELLAELFWTVQKKLLIASIGETTVDEKLLRARCAKAAGMLASFLNAPTLYVAPGDLGLLEGVRFDFRIEADAALHSGSVRLSHDDGEILAGTAEVLANLGREIAQC